MTRIENGRIIDLEDPVNPQDGMTLNHAIGFGAMLPLTWVNGVKKTNVKQYFGSGVVSGGTITFNLTEAGNPIFTNVYLESLNLFTLDLLNQYQFGNIVLSSDKKLLTVSVNRLGSVILGLIQFVTAANGITVYMQIKGD